MLKAKKDIIEFTNRLQTLYDELSNCLYGEDAIPDDPKDRDTLVGGKKYEYEELRDIDYKKLKASIMRLEVELKIIKDTIL